MSDMTDLLNNFGFSIQDSHNIEVMAYRRNLTLADVQAWINEATHSKTITNPCGFVRSRIQTGDKTPALGRRPRTHLSTFTCTCGRVIATPQACPNCDKCPHCCTCPQPNEKEITMTLHNPEASIDQTAYVLLLLKRLVPAVLTRTAPLAPMGHSIAALKQTVCTGRQHWRDRDKPGKTAKLYVIHGTDVKCPLHGSPDPGQRLRVYIGNKPQKIAAALAAIEQINEYQRLNSDRAAILALLRRTIYDLKSMYRRLDYVAPAPDATPAAPLQDTAYPWPNQQVTR